MDAAIRTPVTQVGCANPTTWLRGPTADAVGVRNGESFAFDGSTVGVGEINDLGYLEITFRPSFGNTRMP